MKKDEIQKRREDILVYIAKFADINGFSPSIRDICKAFDISSTCTVFNDLRALENEGRISTAKGITRSIKVLDRNSVFESSVRNVLKYCASENCCKCPRFKKNKCTLIEAVQEEYDY